MPGVIAFGRRWSVGSDDFVVPAVFLFILHFIWFIVAIGLLFGTIWDTGQPCAKLLWIYYIAFLAIMGVCMLVELAICIAALRGGILNTEKRSAVPYLIYVRLVLMLVEVAWFVLAIKWLVEQYTVCPAAGHKEGLLGMVICMGIIHVSAPASAWCVWDAAGRSWVKMKRYQQRSVSSRPGQQHRRRSGSRARNWRQRKVMRAYQDSWDQRCRFLFCCMRRSDRNKNSFADIARLLNDFFRDLDVVPSDVIAGLVLLRKFQKIERDAIVKGHKDDIHAFLSGVKVTSKTQFLALNNPPELEHFQNVIHYMHYALGAYGWPIYLITHSMGVCQLCSRLRCGCFPCFSHKDEAAIVDDNCCQCNYAALRKQLGDGEVEITYATFHVDIGQTPFFIAVDYGMKTVVISIRGTLSIQDILTDLNAEGETLPLTPPIDDWLGHKGMVEAAEYIKNKIKDEHLLETAFNWNPSRGSNDFKLIVVGHSLGGGTAAILAILLRPEYPTLECFSYSPPGGLLSMPAVQYSKAFTTSVVVGKDVVPRIGLHQMESLRADLINAIKRSIDPKWKTIACSAVCCGCAPLPRSATALSTGGDTKLTEYQQVTDENDDGYDNQLYFDTQQIIVHAPPSISGVLEKMQSVDVPNPSTFSRISKASNSISASHVGEDGRTSEVILQNTHEVVPPAPSSNVFDHVNDSNRELLEVTHDVAIANPSTAAFDKSSITFDKEIASNYFEVATVDNEVNKIGNVVRHNTTRKHTGQDVDEPDNYIKKSETTHIIESHEDINNVVDNIQNLELSKPKYVEADNNLPMLLNNEMENVASHKFDFANVAKKNMRNDGTITAQPISVNVYNPVLASRDVDKRMCNIVNVASCSAVSGSGNASRVRPCGDSIACDASSESSGLSAHSLDVFLRSCRMKAKDSARVNAVHPSDSSIALTLHNPLYPPGRIIHVVRHHPSETEQVLPKREPVYQAVWAENIDFDEVLISPVMIQDHMPDKVLAALNKVITHYGPRKPQRTSVTAYTGLMSSENIRSSGHSQVLEFTARTARPLQTPPHRICLETSFTSLQSPSVEVHKSSSKTSSVTSSLYNSSLTTTRATAKMQSPMQYNSILSYDFVSLLDEQVNSSGGTSRTLTPSIISDRFHTASSKLGTFKIEHSPYDFPCARTGKTVAFHLNGGLKNTDKPPLKKSNSGKVDLIHDDWFGQAPLASPESMSELSSIGSKSSLIYQNDCNFKAKAQIETKLLETAHEYGTSTPKVLRRTPGIPGNLSNCADDVRNVINFQKTNQNFRFLRCPRNNSFSGSSGDSSFESAISIDSSKHCTAHPKSTFVKNKIRETIEVHQTDKSGFRSAENIIEANKIESEYVTRSDTNILESEEQHLPPSLKCPRLDKCGSPSNDTNNKTLNKQIVSNTPHISTSSDLYLSTKSSIQSYESFETPLNTASPLHRRAMLLRDRNILGSSHSSSSSLGNSRLCSVIENRSSPINKPFRSDSAKLLEDSSTSACDSDETDKSKVVSFKKRRKSLGEKVLTHNKNESLPLLSSISNTAALSSPSYVKRKRYSVYPETTTLLNKEESSV